MAAINPAILAALKTALMKNYNDGLALVTPTWNMVASEVPSTTLSNTYGWLGQMPGFREWVGDRVVNDIKSFGYAITNKDWEMTIGVARNDIEDDNLGQYSMLFQEMGRATNVHPDQLVYALLAAGHTTNCYDGQYFFDTDHPVYPNHDGTGTATTVSNVTAGTGSAWYLLDTTRAVKPIIFQNRKKAAFQAMDKPDDENVFTKKEFRYGVDSRSNVGFGFWQMAHKSQAALNSASFNAAYAAMTSRKGDGGRPLAITPSLLVVPPTLREAALETIKAERNAAGATNVNRNAVEVLVCPYLA